MSRKFFCLLVLLCCLSCMTPKIKQLPPSGPYYQTMSIKFNFMDRQGKQKGRIHWRFDERSGKFLFFTPLNQVALELDTVGEVALLINFDKKIFWRGDFSFLLNRIWGIDISLTELKLLLNNGLVPEAKIKEKGLVFSLESARDGQPPQSVRIRQGDALLTLKILKNEAKAGNIVLLNYDSRFQSADLEDVLADD
jgi:hypothetical protein